MKLKHVALSLALLLTTLHCRAQDSTVSPAQLQQLSNTIDARTAGLSDSLQNLADTVTRLRNALSVSDYYDSAGVAFLQKDATAIYTLPGCQKGVYRIPGWLLFTIIIVGGLYLFGYTSLCRDESFDKNGKLRHYKQRPYSYSKVQLFWWTMIILGCYVAFFSIYGQLIPLNLTTVVLLGLGATVLAGGKIIDERQKRRMPAGERNQDGNAMGDSFFEDILSDDGGVSIHRFQSLIFNAAFGIGFIAFFISAVCNRAYPFIEFNEWQFALLGISSATYLGMKTTENSSASTPSRTDEEEEATRNINQD